MDSLGELLASDHRHTLEFFVVVRDVSEPDVDWEELLYNASVLAHFSQQSVDADLDAGTPGDLGAVFDHYVMTDLGGHRDPAIMEAAGAQCLLMAGFFEDQMRRRHNIHWYAELGASFFRRAADEEDSPSKAHLLGALAKRFEPWRQRHARLSRELRDLPYLLGPRRVN